MNLFKGLLIGLLVVMPVRAAEPQASEASVRELLVATQSQKLVDGMYAQMDSIMEASMQQALGGKTLNPEQRKIMDSMRAEMVAMFKEEMSWRKLEPEIIEIYRQSFTEQEVKGMLEFYRSPHGKAVIAKMPVVMQASMRMTQNRMAVMMPKLQQLQEKTAERLKAASAEQQ